MADTQSQRCPPFVRRPTPPRRDLPGDYISVMDACLFPHGERTWITDSRTVDGEASTDSRNWPGTIMHLLAILPWFARFPTRRSVMPGSAAKVVITERQQAVLRQ